MASFSDRLRQLRGNRTQADMARFVGLKQPHYARYESGVTTPGIDVLIRFCQILNVSSDWLLGLETKNNPSIIANNSAFGHGNIIGGDCSNCPVIKAALKKLNK